MEMGATVSKAEYVGKRLGRAWRGFVRQESRATQWMVDRGLSRLVAVSILWIVKLIVLAILLYAAFWLALVVALVAIAAAVARHASPDDAEHYDEDAGRPEWERGEPTDHRQRLFYDPLSYNDDPDPRFHDPRLDDK